MENPKQEVKRKNRKQRRNAQVGRKVVPQMEQPLPPQQPKIFQQDFVRSIRLQFHLANWYLKPVYLKSRLEAQVRIMKFTFLFFTYENTVQPVG